MRSLSLRILIGLAVFASSCRTVAPPPAIDPRLAARVPEDVSAIGGFCPSSFPGLSAAFADQRYVLIALRGSEVLTITPNQPQPLPARHRPSSLLTEAEQLAEKSPAWVVIRGGTVLPLQGNLANLNRFLHEASVVKLTADGVSPVRVGLEASCPTAETAERFERSLRAALALTNVSGPSKISRDGQTVRGSLTVTPEAVRRFLR